MVKHFGDLDSVGTVSGSHGAFSTSLTISGLPVSAGAAGMIEPLDFGWTAAATGTLTLEESALYPYTINSLIGRAAAGVVSGTLRINNVVVQGIDNQTWNATQSTKTASSANSVAIGQRVDFVVSGTSNGNFAGFTLRTTRT